MENSGKSALRLQILDRAVGTPVVGGDDSVVRKIGFRSNAVNTCLRIVEAVPRKDDDGDGSRPGEAIQGLSPAIGLLSSCSFISMACRRSSIFACCSA
jgi:hypothetical protein